MADWIWAMGFGLSKHSLSSLASSEHSSDLQGLREEDASLVVGKMKALSSWGGPKCLQLLCIIRKPALGMWRGHSE